MLAGSSRILNSSCSRTFSQLQVSWGFGRPFLAFVAFLALSYLQGNGAYKSFVVDFLFVQNGRDVFVHGANKETCFGYSSFSTPVLFLKQDSTAALQVHWD